MSAQELEAQHGELRPGLIVRADEGYAFIDAFRIDEDDADADVRAHVSGRRS